MVYLTEIKLINYIFKDVYHRLNSASLSKSFRNIPKPKKLL